MNQSAKGCVRTLANNLREQRLRTGETQEAAAERSGLSYRNYQAIEASKGNPALKTLDALALHYKQTVSNLFRLSTVRVPDSNQFLMKLKQYLPDSEHAVLVRDFDGLILWGNKKMSQEALINAETMPIKLISMTSRSTQDTLRAQMEAQKLGYVQPVVVAHPNGNANTFICYYPILVYVKREYYPALALVYAVSTNEDCEARYYDFCNELLNLL